MTESATERLESLSAEPVAATLNAEAIDTMVDNICIEAAKNHKTLSKQERDDLILNNLGLVKSLAYKFSRAGFHRCDSDELIGVGNLRLVEVAEQYDPSTGVPFSSFAYIRIKYAMMNFIMENITLLKLSVRDMRRLNDMLIEQKNEGYVATAFDDLDVLPLDIDSGTDTLIEDKEISAFEEEEMHAEIEFISQKILQDNPDEFIVFSRHTGLYDGREWTFLEICNLMKKSYGSVFRLYNRAVSHIRDKWKLYKLEVKELS